VLFNINNYVRVKLTKEGRSLLHETHEIYQNLYPAAGIPDLEIAVDFEGYTKFQFHELMRIFGREMYNGGPMMFDAVIDISEEPLP
jgi:hypothetical protein